MVFVCWGKGCLREIRKTTKPEVGVYVRPRLSKSRTAFLGGIGWGAKGAVKSPPSTSCGP